MIELVGTGFIFTTEMICAGCALGIFSVIQPWSLTLKAIGVFFSLGCYAMLPFIIAGAFV
jgi:hypothetical protein